MQTIYWLLIFVVLLVIEIFTMGLTTIWFAGGALVAFAAGILGLGLPVQVILFIVVSVVLFVGTRPLAMKYFNKEREKTNADSLIGKQAIVTEDIDTLQAKGRVEIQGQEWSARTVQSDGKVAAGTVVVVEEIQGVKLLVRVKEEKKC